MASGEDVRKRGKDLYSALNGALIHRAKPLLSSARETD